VFVIFGFLIFLFLNSYVPAAELLIALVSEPRFGNLGLYFELNSLEEKAIISTVDCHSWKK
jgi:hypothetical protein